MINSSIFSLSLIIVSVLLYKYYLADEAGVIERCSCLLLNLGK